MSFWRWLDRTLNPGLYGEELNQAEVGKRHRGDGPPQGCGLYGGDWSFQQTQMKDRESVSFQRPGFGLGRTGYGLGD